MDELYQWVRAGLTLYRADEYFSAHEAWEVAWHTSEGDRKTTLKALIQLAAAFEKQKRGEPAGLEKNLAKAANTLARVERRAELSLDLVRLSADIERARADVRAAQPPALPATAAPDGVLYLHGFASSPKSKKAQIVRAHLEGFAVRVPDQNEDDFTHLTVSRALRLCRRHLFDRTLVIGSSLGGYIATLLAREESRVGAQMLMAPAFDFAQRLEQRFGAQAIASWKAFGAVPILHYGYDELCPIDYGILGDAQKYPAEPPVETPAIIVHGRHDDQVPLELSERAARANPAVELRPVEDDHALAQSTEIILKAVDELVGSLSLRPSPLEMPLEEARALADRSKGG